MGSICARLRTIRYQWQLSLREVERRSRRLAQEKGDLSYQVSASWLDRLEREEHELTVTKLMTLAEIYNVSPEQLLRSINPAKGQNRATRPLSSQGANGLQSDRPLEARYLNPDTLFCTQSPDDETNLLATGNGQSPSPYSQGIIGKHDLTLDPMIPAGSIVRINTNERAISIGRNWTHEFRRPIYFLRTRDAYVCGWCELDKNSEWLTLVPHSLSPVRSRRWRYGTEIESIGRVVMVAIRLTN